MTPPRINDIAAFMKARHDIYLARKAGKPGPWTDDQVLRDGRFCNIFRELDTVTIWIDQNIRQPFADHEHLWFMLAIARYINWPDTLRYLMDEAEPGTWPSEEGFDPAKITKALEEYAVAGNKVYTGAYMIRAESDPTKPWYSWSKHRYIAEIVLGRLWEDRAYFEETLNEDKTNNDYQNLQLLTRAEHAKLHGKGRAVTEEIRQKMRAGAARRVSDPEHRRLLSERAKAQHAEGRLGRATWSESSDPGPEVWRKVGQKQAGRLRELAAQTSSEEMRRRSYQRKMSMRRPNRSCSNAWGSPRS